MTQPMIIDTIYRLLHYGLISVWSVVFLVVVYLVVIELRVSYMIFRVRHRKWKYSTQIRHKPDLVVQYKKSMQRGIISSVKLLSIYFIALLIIGINIHFLLKI
jgi:hypothetical protein